MKKNITVPDSWNDVTIGQFQEIKAQDIESKDYMINVISILLDKDPEEIRKYDIASANKISRHLEWIMKLPNENSYKQEIEIDGVVYIMIENLNRFSNGEWFDMEDCREDLFGKLDYLFAMFYRPKGEEYSASKCRERANIFAEKASIGEVYGALVFFSNVGKKSMISIQDYLIRQSLAQVMSKTKKKSWMKKRLRNGIGTHSIIR